MEAKKNELMSKKRENQSDPPPLENGPKIIGLDRPNVDEDLGGQLL